MFFPYSTSHQLITNMANSARETIEIQKSVDHRHATMDELHARRIHELMHFRPHTVDTDGF